MPQRRNAEMVDNLKPDFIGRNEYVGSAYINKYWDIPAAGGCPCIPDLTFTTPDELTFGSVVALQGADNDSGLATPPTHTAALSSTTFVTGFIIQATGVGYVVVFTVDGSNNITWGTPVQYEASQVNNWHVVALDSSTFAITYRINAVADVTVIAGTVSGTTPTLGSKVTLSAQLPEADPIHYHHSGPRNSTNIVIAYCTSTSKTKVVNVAVSGTTVGTFTLIGNKNEFGATDNPAVGCPDEDHFIITRRYPKGYAGTGTNYFLLWDSFSFSGGTWSNYTSAGLAYSGTTYYVRSNRNRLNAMPVCGNKVATAFVWETEGTENAKVALATLDDGAGGIVVGDHQKVATDVIWPRVGPFDANRFLMAWYDRLEDHSWVALVNARGGYPSVATMEMFHTSGSGVGMHHPLALAIDADRFIIVCRRLDATASPTGVLAALVGTVS